MLSNILKIIRAFSYKERLLFALCFFVFIITAILLIINIFFDKTRPIPIVGGEYREGVVGQPIFINPVLARFNTADSALVNILFKNVPSLSENIKVDESGKVWTVRILEGVKWHDGQDITSDDIIFTIQAIQDPNSNSPLSPFWQGVVPQRISERELKLTLPRPYFFFKETLTNLRPIPKHIFAQIPTANFRLSSYNLAPIGSGLFRYDHFDKRGDGFITAYYLVRASNAKDKPPFLENITFKFYSKEEDAIFAFNANEIDGLSLVDNRNLSKIKIKHQLSNIRLPRYYVVFLNQYTNPVLKDKNVRLALNLSVSRLEMINKIFGGYGIDVKNLILPGMSGYMALLETATSSDNNYDFAPQRAIDLLIDSGWQKNQDGVWEKIVPLDKNSISKEQKKSSLFLKFRLAVPDIPPLVDMAYYLKDSWSKIGINVEVAIFSISQLENEIIKTRDYEMLLLGHVFNNNEDLLPFWHSTERFYPGLNLALYENKKVDVLLESMRGALDYNIFEQSLLKLNNEILSDIPAVFLVSPDYLYITRTKLKGLELDKKFIASPGERFQNIENWHIKTARVFK